MSWFNWLFGTNSKFSKWLGYYKPHKAQPIPPVVTPTPEPVVPPSPSYVARKGIVRAVSRSFLDDDGYFYPLGATLMWGLYGFRHERDRLESNLDFLAKHKWDYVRVLGEVGWGDRSIDPSWPDYDTVLTGFIDLAYDKYGLRTELTLVGGGTPTDYVAFAGRVATLLAGRQHKVMNFECVNEKFKNFNNDQAIGHMITALKPLGCLVAASSGGGDEVAYCRSMAVAGATLGTTHMDRTYGDDGWRAVRQPWDFKDLPFPVSHNEPIGPRSSGAQCDDPLQLAMLRATGIVCGVGAFVLHNAAGVTGLVDPTHDRPANLFEVPNIDSIMVAVRNVDLGLPEQCNEGAKYGPWWGGNPFPPVKDGIWSDGHPFGVNRSYLSSYAGGWVCALAGIKDHADMVPFTTGRLALFDPITGGTTYLGVIGGQTVTIQSGSKDKGGYGGYIVRSA